MAKHWSELNHLTHLSRREAKKNQAKEEDPSSEAASREREDPEDGGPAELLTGGAPAFEHEGRSVEEITERLRHEAQRLARESRYAIPPDASNTHRRIASKAQDLQEKEERKANERRAREHEKAIRDAMEDAEYLKRKVHAKMNGWFSPGRLSAGLAGSKYAYQLKGGLSFFNRPKRRLLWGSEAYLHDYIHELQKEFGPGFQVGGHPHGGRGELSISWAPHERVGKSKETHH